MTSSDSVGGGSMTRRNFIRTSSAALAGTALGGCASSFQLPSAGIQGEAFTLSTPSGGKMRLTLEDPIPIALSEPGETRWGYHQFVSLSPYPGGRLLARYSAAADAVAAYGVEQPTCISDDQGRTWRKFSEPGLPGSGHVFPAGDGDYVCVPPSPPMSIEHLELPEPLNADIEPQPPHLFYKLSDCPEEVRYYMTHVQAARWERSTGEWREAELEFASEDALVWRGLHENRRDYLARSWVEHVPIIFDGDLLYAGYRQNYLTPDGDAPVEMASWCMASVDHGRSFHPRAMIAEPTDPRALMGEPQLTVNTRGELICVIRQTISAKLPMAICYSSDGGRTWSSPENFREFGVLPAIISLECGALLCSYGRPGVHLIASPDGRGREWTEDHTLIEAATESVYTSRLRRTDGYTSMMPLGPNSFIVAYSHFEYPGPEGQCKAILVQRGKVEV